MKKRRGFCFKWLGIFLMLLFGFTAGGKTAEAAGYSQDYRYWSQGSSDYIPMRQVGCLITAQAKMLYEANVNRNADFNPDYWYRWLLANGGIASSTSLEILNHNVPERYAASLGKSLTYLGASANVADAQIWSNINAGKYTIIHIKSDNNTYHWVMVDNNTSKAKGQIYIYDSFSGDPNTSFTTYNTGPRPLSAYSNRIKMLTYQGGGNPSDRAPQGSLDFATGGTGTVRVAGWAFDADTPKQPIAVHVYIGGNSGDSGAECHGIDANLLRPDIGTAYQNLGIGNNHGFDATIKTSKTGTQPVYIYAINSQYGGSSPQIGYGIVNISKDSSKPVISNIKVTNITHTGYTVSCTVTDNVGVSKVQFPTWRRRDSSAGCIWYDGVKNGNTWSFTFKDAIYSDEYMTHIYAYDTAGNSSSAKCDAVYCAQKGSVPAIVNGGIYVLRTALNEKKVIDCADNSNAYLWDYNSGKVSWQQFKIEQVSGGYYKLAAMNGGKVLTVSGGNANAGANLGLAQWNGSDAQLFKFNSAGNGYYFIVSKLGSYVDVTNGTTANGTNVQMYSYGAVKNQSWKLEFVKCTSHVWDDGVVTKKATCTKEGAKLYHCKNCPATKIEAILAAGHRAATWKTTKAATCTQKGINSYVCGICQEVIATETIPAKGHGAGTWKVTKAATCTQTGTKAYVCGTCGATIRSEGIPAAGHTYQTVTDKAATCTAAGSRHKECSVCGYKAGSETIPAKGHGTGTWKVTKAASCTQAGTKAYVCGVCGGTIRNESISATGHTYRVVTDKKATCTAAGSRHKECDVCGHKAGSETIAAAGHQYGAYQVTKKATISSTGIKKRTCKVCKESETKRISKLKASIKVEKTKLSVGVKKTVPAPKVTYQRGDKIQSWKSANKAIATVSKSGRITGKKAGTTTITVRLKSGKTAKIKVTVKKTVTPKIKLNRTKVTLKKGKAYSLKISVTPQSIRNKIKFTSSNKKVAVVSSKGKITAKRRGSATVKVYYGKVSAKCRVTVK